MEGFLTPTDIERITRPLVQPAAQSRWLTSQGISHSRARDGSIVVTWWQVNNPFSQQQHHLPDEEPNWGAARR